MEAIKIHTNKNINSNSFSKKKNYPYTSMDARTATKYATARRKSQIRNVHTENIRKKL